jgi:hypothetical protein
MRQVLVCGLLCAAIAGYPDSSYAANILISRTQTSYNGSEINPGDIVTLQAGTRDRLTINQLHGTSDNPIIIRNELTATQPVVFRRASGNRGGFVFACNSCIHVVIDGTGKWSGADPAAYCGAPAGTTGCGIKITAGDAGDEPNAYLRLGGLSSNVIVRGIEVDGRWPDLARGWVGIKFDDVKLKPANYPGLWRENILLEKNYVHNVLTEGFYIGPICCDKGIPLRNVTIRDNLVRNVGWDGIQLKSAYSGTNEIHGNLIQDVGLDTRTTIPPGELMGISCSDTRCNVFDNLVVNSGESGYQARVSALKEELGPLVVNFYNNVTVNAGVMGTIRGHGFNIQRATNSVARFKTSIYNNTIVTPTLDGIAVRGPNLGADTNISSNILAGIGDHTIVAPTGSTIVRNGIGTVSFFRFLDPGRRNYRLASDSPARDAGALNLFSLLDPDGVLRPQGLAPDQGAYEYAPK